MLFWNYVQTQIEGKWFRTFYFVEKYLQCRYPSLHSSWNLIAFYMYICKSICTSVVIVYVVHSIGNWTQFCAQLHNALSQFCFSLHRWHHVSQIQDLDIIYCMHAYIQPAQKTKKIRYRACTIYIFDRGVWCIYSQLCMYSIELTC